MFLKNDRFYSDKKFFTRDFINKEWVTYQVFCGNHYEDRFYIVDDFGVLIQTSYTWLNYGNSYKSDIRYMIDFKA